jgi:ribonuclease Z
MAELIILGSSNAIPTLGSENTHFAIVAGAHTVLVDCVSSPVVRLEQAGIDLQSITDVILTHFHPDHVGGFPLLLMDMWLLGRKQPLNVYGLHYTLDRTATMMGLYGWSKWPNFFTVNFCRIPADEMATVLQTPELDIFCSPVNHFLPNIGLRVEFKAGKKVFAYSCDTEPCPAVVQLAQAADLLLHEASGPFKGHSSAAQAGEVAAEAGAKSLSLIHYPTGRFTSGDLVAEARQHFSGEISLARDLQRVQF